MNSFDFIILIIFALFIIRGIFRGLITELMVLAALIIGLLTAVFFLTPAVYLLIEIFPKLPEFAAKIIGFILIFTGVNIAARIAGAILNKFIKITFLQPVNKIAGGIFAFLKIAIIFSIVFIIVDQIPGSKYLYEYIGANQSLVFNPVKEFAPLVYSFFMALIPGHQDMQEQFIKTLIQADSTTKQLLIP